MNFLTRSFDHQNQWWKYLLVVLAGFGGGQMVGSIPLIGIVAYKMIASGGAIMFNPENMADLTVFGLSKNVGLLLMLLPFVVSLAVTILLINVLHKRTFAETVNGTKRLRYKRFGAGFVVWLGLMAVYFAGDYFLNPDNFVLQFDIAKFLPLLLISVLLIPLQTAYEELLFRGYLAQGVAVLTRNRILAFVIPAVLFALLHSFNPEVTTFGFWLAMSQYLFFGLLFGLVAVLDNGIELSIGMHTANNLFLSLMLTSKTSALQTDAVFEQLSLNAGKDTLLLIVMGVLATVFFAWRYKWDFGILAKKIEE
ncbi:abortive infection protein [Bacteroidia bacterium]|nr:abortive infection protein [Bacteroidia bacterium]